MSNCTKIPNSPEQIEKHFAENHLLSQDIHHGETSSMRSLNWVLNKSPEANTCSYPDPNDSFLLKGELGRDFCHVTEMSQNMLQRPLITEILKKSSAIHREKFQFSTRISQNRILASSDLFDVFTLSIKFYTFHCHILKSTDV